MKELQLIPPTDPRVNNAIAPFVDDMLKDEDIKDRKELSDAMFESMNKYGGIGLSANQVGLPFNMFVIGGHPSIENGLKMTCFNPMIVSTGEEEVMMKEGCLTYPFIFLDIKRPRKIVAKYTDENGDLQEAHLDGMMSRIFQHEYDHMLGRNFTERVSKFKLKRAMDKREKMIKKIEKSKQA
tara:strand:- start:255 stop:800 length:546 start_codon:yes stop_codon:yes gene_type:complete